MLLPTAVPPNDCQESWKESETLPVSLPANTAPTTSRFPSDTDDRSTVAVWVLALGTRNVCCTILADGSLVLVASGAATMIVDRASIAKVTSASKPFIQFLINGHCLIRIVKHGPRTEKPAQGPCL